MVLFCLTEQAAAQPMGKSRLMGPEINPLVVSLQSFWWSCGAFNLPTRQFYLFEDSEETGGFSKRLWFMSLDLDESCRSKLSFCNLCIANAAFSFSESLFVFRGQRLAAVNKSSVHTLGSCLARTCPEMC